MGGVLKILGGTKFIDRESLRDSLLTCQSQVNIVILLYMYCRYMHEDLRCNMDLVRYISCVGPVHQGSALSAVSD